MSSSSPLHLARRCREALRIRADRREQLLLLMRTGVRREAPDPAGDRAVEQRRLRGRPDVLGEGARDQDGRAILQDPRPVPAPVCPGVLLQLRALRRHEREDEHDLSGLRTLGEVYSIDESFLDLTDVQPRLREEMARDLRATVLRWTGIPTCVAIGPTKTLAKLANHIAKMSPPSPASAT